MLSVRSSCWADCEFGFSRTLPARGAAGSSSVSSPSISWRDTMRGSLLGAAGFSPVSEGSDTSEGLGRFFLAGRIPPKTFLPKASSRSTNDFGFCGAAG